MRRRSFFAWLLAAVFGWNVQSKKELPFYTDPYLTDNHAWYLKDHVEVWNWWWRDKDGRIYCNAQPTPHKQMPLVIFREL
ncbi:hypothetical protein LCGC14_2365210 [marine sediment metagenome]|uniref:Uncharacterized protein n=1 Tax=marine sediment metagenome TaxID=412755 RepID=A0A0F9EHW9_9ZZZZ